MPAIGGARQRVDREFSFRSRHGLLRSPISSATYAARERNRSPRLWGSEKQGNRRRPFDHGGDGEGPPDAHFRENRRQGPFRARRSWPPPPRNRACRGNRARRGPIVTKRTPVRLRSSFSREIASKCK